TIFQLSKKTLSVVNRKSPVSHRLSEKFDCIHALSSSHVLLASSKNLIIYDTVYGTTQAELSIPNTFLTAVNTADPLSFYTVVASENDILIVPINIPATAMLLDAIGKAESYDLPSTAPQILLPAKKSFKKETLNTALPTLF